jgi:hypothetical protein
MMSIYYVIREVSCQRNTLGSSSISVVEVKR